MRFWGSNMAIARNSVIVTENIEKERIEYYVTKSSSAPTVNGIGTVNPPYSLSDGDYVYEQVHYYHTDGTETYGEWRLSYLFSNVTNIQNIVTQVVEKNSSGKWEIRNEILKNTFVYEPLRDANGNIVYDSNGNAVADQNKPISISSVGSKISQTDDKISLVVSGVDSTGGVEISDNFVKAMADNILLEGDFISALASDSVFVGTLGSNINIGVDQIVMNVGDNSQLLLSEDFIQALSNDGFIVKSNLTDGQTTISGNNITTGIIKSNGYVPGTANDFSTKGLEVDLDNSLIVSPYFLINKDGAKIKGEVDATSGRFGTEYPFAIGENGLIGYSKFGKDIYRDLESGSSRIDLSDGSFDDIVIDVFADRQSYDKNDIQMTIDTVYVNGRCTVGITTKSSNHTQVDDPDASNEDAEISYLFSEEVTDFSFALSDVPTDVSADVFIYSNNGERSYRYVYTSKHSNIVNDIIEYISKDYENDGNIASFTVDIDYARINVLYSYKLSGIDMHTHIGTDYFDYSGLIVAKDGEVELSNVLVNKDLRTYGNMFLTKPDSILHGTLGNSGKWYLGSQRERGTALLEMGVYGSKPICVSQSNDTNRTITNRITLLDKDGNTIVPNTLLVDSIRAKTSALSVDSETINLNALTLYVGDASSSSSKRIRFKNSVGTNLHDCYIFGGDGANKNAFGVHDAKHGRNVINYKDDENKFYVNTGNFYFYDYGGTLRQPISSNSTDGNRISQILSNASGVRIYGQWGTSGASFSYKTFAPSSSDIRLKENIGRCEVENAIGIIDSIKLHSFDWKDYRDNKHQKIGFVADELEKIDDRLSIGGECDEDGIIGYKSVDTFYLLGYVVKAIQELSDENKRLRNIVDKIK